MSNEFDQSIAEQNGVSKVSPREMLLRYIHFLPWFLLSVSIALTIAFLNLRYSSRIYNVTGNILVKDDNPYTSAGGKFDDIFLMQPNRSLNDEMQIIKSRETARRVVKKLGLQTMYYAEGKVRSSLIYHKESPLDLDILHLKDSTRGFNIQIEVLNEDQFSLGEKTDPILFGETFEMPFGSFKMNRTNNSFSPYADRKFMVNWLPEEQRAIQIMSGLKVGLSGDASNILALNYQTENTKSGVAIVNQFMQEYQQMGLEDKNKIAENALVFINDQLDTVQRQLGIVENRLRGYRESNKVYNPEQQSLMVFTEAGNVENQITEQSVKLKVVDYLINYVKDDRNLYRVGLSTLGIEEPTLIEQISELNKLQVQRETLLKTTLPGNPVIVDLEASIKKLRSDIQANLQNVRQSYQVVLNDLNAKSMKANREISTIPLKEKQMLDITRQQKIMEELYSFLLQKKLETSIGRASTMPSSRVIESALASNIPVKPNPRTIYLTAFILGLAIPGAVIFLIEFLNDKIRGREDIERATQAPILGEIGHSLEKQALVVSRSSRKFIAEQFRIIRTNLQYVLPKTEKPVILVTSSFSGEGKSFVSINTGAVMALTGKKTVILEFDIRKPKVSANLGLTQKTGLTNFIIGKAGFEELPVPVSDVENLYVIPCGPIPPNPSELLLSERLEELFAELKRNFDIIIIDTAPVGLVSDAITLGRFADSTLYILRHNYTFKKQLKMIDELYVQKRLPNLSLIINDIAVERGYGSYHSYGGYGTGYGYGYGEGYYDNEPSRNRWYRRVFRKIRS